MPYGEPRLLLQQEVRDDTLAAARVTHLADVLQIDLADELRAEGRAPVVVNVFHLSRWYWTS